MFFVFLVIGAFVLHWIIRTAVSGGMKDFERWKRKWYIESDDQGDERP